MPLTWAGDGLLSGWTPPPWNLRFVRNWLEVFPKAKFIHIVRDGRAVAKSAIKNQGWVQDMVDAAQWWQSHLGEGLAAEQAYGPEVVSRVRFEDLVTDPQQSMRRLARFAGIAYEDSMAVGGRFKMHDKQYHQLIGKPPQAARAEAWREELCLEEIENFEYVTGDLLAYLGYPLLFGMKARKPVPTER